MRAKRQKTESKSFDEMDSDGDMTIVPLELKEEKVKKGSDYSLGIFMMIHLSLLLSMSCKKYKMQRKLN